MASFQTCWRCGHGAQRQGESLNDKARIPAVGHRAAASHSFTCAGQVAASVATGVASRFAHGAVDVPGYSASLSGAIGSLRAARSRSAEALRVAPLCGARLSPFVAVAPAGSSSRGIVAGLCARSRPYGAFGALSFNALRPFALRPLALGSWVAAGFCVGHLTPRCSGPQVWPAASPVAAELER